jgi:predicted enzyme related to lactoylglutathione lyase
MAESMPSDASGASGTSNASGMSNASGTSDASGTSGASVGFEEGVPCWVDARLSDVEAGKRFYGELFGWTFQEAYGSATWAYSEGSAVAALASKRDGRMPTVWTVYFATHDAAGTARRIREAGGELITAPVPVGPYGTMALAADPEGAVFGLWVGAEHAGFERRHGPGTFCRAQVYSRDAEAVAPFYEHVPLGGPGARDFGRSAVRDVFSAEMPPHFLVHFSVEDCDAAVGTVSRLGGRIQASPFDTWYGVVAVVTDNQGASFAMLQR